MQCHDDNEGEGTDDEKLREDSHIPLFSTGITLIAFTFPGCTQPTGPPGVHLKNLGAVAVHLSIASRRQPSDARSYDNY